LQERFRGVGDLRQIACDERGPPLRKLLDDESPSFLLRRIGVGRCGLSQRGISVAEVLSEAAGRIDPLRTLGVRIAGENLDLRRVDRSVAVRVLSPEEGEKQLSRPPIEARALECGEGSLSLAFIAAATTTQ